MAETFFFGLRHTLFIADGVAYIARMPVPSAFTEIADNLSYLDDWEDRYKYIIELGQALQRRVSRWLSGRDSADTNHDGRLTEDEAARAPSIAEAFKTMGRNNDRAVTREEYESHAIDRMYRDSELPYVAPNIIEKRF